MTKPLSTALPLDAATLLAQAARTTVPKTDPLVRQKAVEKAIEQVKQKYPHLFKE